MPSWGFADTSNTFYYRLGWCSAPSWKYVLFSPALSSILLSAALDSVPLLPPGHLLVRMLSLNFPPKLPSHRDFLLHLHHGILTNFSLNTSIIIASMRSCWLASGSSRSIFEIGIKTVMALPKLRKSKIQPSQKIEKRIPHNLARLDFVNLS